MSKRTTTTEGNEKIATRHYLRVVAFAILSVSVLALLMLHAYPHLTTRIVVTKEETPIATSTTATPVVGLSHEEPVELRIPKIQLDATFEEPLGLRVDRTIEVPDSFEKVGWYRYGAAPGEVGTAVILGHVDSYKGPAVFYSLGQLAAGDPIYVKRADGQTATFTVEYAERYSQNDFPTERVYGMTSTPTLRLITCTGVYDHGTKKYSHNLVVYAKLQEPEANSSDGTSDASATETNDSAPR